MQNTILSFAYTRELAALLNASDSQTVQGRRDYALLLFLVRTGARVSEAVGIDAADLRLEPPQQILLRGKGRKHRRVPLAADLTQTLRAPRAGAGSGRVNSVVFDTTRGRSQ